MLLEKKSGAKNEHIRIDNYFLSCILITFRDTDDSGKQCDLHLEGGEPALELVDGLAGLPQEQRDGGRGHTGLHRQPAYLHRQRHQIVSQDD